MPAFCFALTILDFLTATFFTTGLAEGFWSDTEEAGAVAAFAFSEPEQIESGPNLGNWKG